MKPDAETIKLFAGLTKVISEYLTDSKLRYFLIAPVGDDIYVTGNISDVVMDDLPVAEIAAKLKGAIKEDDPSKEKHEIFIKGELH